MNWPAPERRSRCVWTDGAFPEWAHCACGFARAASDARAIALWHAARCPLVRHRIDRARARVA